jgi:hypothetical protein
MSRSIITLFATVSLLVPTFGQTPNQSPGQSNCFTAIQSPAVRGIRLGMTAEEVFALFPASSERPENKNAILSAEQPPNYGIASLSFQPSTYPSPAKERFAAIDSVSITLFDGRVTDIQVAYAGPDSNPRGPVWNNVDDFIAKLSEAFALPAAKYWFEYSGYSKTLKCAGFEMEASNQNRQGRIRLRNNGYIDAARQRAAADEEKRRRDFKP